LGYGGCLAHLLCQKIGQTYLTFELECSDEFFPWGDVQFGSHAA